MPFDLTRQELRCLELAASGLRTKNISSRLGLSERTIENHLGRAYRKLNVTDRVAAGEKLSNWYSEQKLSVPPASDVVPFRPVFEAGAADPKGMDGAKSRGLYGVYERLGPWRRPRRIGGTLLLSILAWTLAGLIFLLVMMSIGTTLFHLGDPVSEQHYSRINRN